MKPNPCICCGDARGIGSVFFERNQICRVCRDLVLTWFQQSGIMMTDKHPFIAELCEHSHYVKSAWWKYYNSVTQRQESIIRLTVEAKVESGIIFDDALDILNDL